MSLRRLFAGLGIAVVASLSLAAGAAPSDKAAHRDKPAHSEKVADGEASPHSEEPEIAASAGSGENPDEKPRQYTFAWMFSDDDTMAPRGGTSRGPEVTLDNRVAPAFEALQEPGLSARERDRRAILAMVGDYRTSFDFIETVGLTPGYEPRAPYQSWGTERVYLVADEEDYISLQHIIVMHFAQDDGSVSEPMVVKHWRQDWRYEDREVHAFLGRNRFAKDTLASEDVEGAWTQTVYQVDDSPRYEAVGRWVHAPGASFWESEDRRRPLPRREFSVRDDYHALYGSHRITITPSGWSMEEDALKLVLDENNDPVADQPYLAREAGLSRYERLSDYDFSAGDAYWEKTAAAWALVRDYWDALYAERDAFAFAKSVDGMPMFMALFELAEADGVTPQQVEDTLAPYVR
ncbi:MAG: DUF6607 family protein [Halieaceae bacterium]|jgi:hypothetical protein|nr:DUF6607 family protein [Halieaceae bacterium]